MRGGRFVSVIIPALNEREAIPRVIAEVPGWVDDIIVADNGSDDGTGKAAEAAGARVVREEERGYGAACLAGLAALDPRTGIVVFLDGDYSDYPADMAELVDPIAGGEAQLVIGSRVLGGAEKGALTPQQVFGNWLATRLIRMIWKTRFTDLGPFRAIARPALDAIDMRDRDFGWTVEMQVKAARQGLDCREVPVRYRRRTGVSKVSGTLSGSVKAGVKIIWVIVREAMASAKPRPRAVPRD